MSICYALNKCELLSLTMYRLTIIWVTCVTYVTGPAKIGHVGSQNLTTFQTSDSHNFQFQYSTATKISEFVNYLIDFTTLLTESKY